MWGIFVGFALGVFEVILLRKTVMWMTADKKSGTAKAIPIIFLKLVIIFGVLYLLALVSVTTMIWGAGGIAVAMIVMPIILNKRAQKAAAQDQATGEDKNA